MGLKLNLGCGANIMEGWMNVDIKPGKGVDKIVDLDKAWPWKDSSVDEIYMKHTLEHLADQVKSLKEAKRVLRKGGKLTIRGPFYNHYSAFADPTHKSNWLTPYSFYWIELYVGGFRLAKRQFLKSTLGKLIPSPVLAPLSLVFGNLVQEMIFELEKM
ncbi:methyltransferase domain-containing protein [Candidatus Woesearchaeota archaeon]|nr:methyltransferase domain-containing protein [Candidatus Woesearchaeota archaeon]